MTQSDLPAQQKKSTDLYIVPLILAIMIGLARYLYIGSFGWYEDDLTIIPKAVQMSFPTLMNYIYSYIVHLNGHARPLSDSLIYLFSNIGWRLDGFVGMYLIGYLIITANILLFYALLRRISNPSFAILGALAYCFYSADTTQSFLTHSLGLHPSITLLLLAYHTYLSKRKVLAYILVFVILFSYETPFLVFLAAPLLGERWSRKTIWKMILHGAILAAMLLIVFLIRSSVGEGRVTGLTFIDTLLIPLTHMVEGPLVSLGTYLYRPYQAIRGLTLEMAIVMLVSLPVFYWILSKFSPIRTGGIPPSFEQGWKQAHIQAISPEWQRLLQMAIAGAIMLIMAYPLTFTVRAFALTGRDTRVHAAGVLGASILLACAATALLWIFKRYQKTSLGYLLISGLFALLLGYGILLQHDYTAAWKYQQEFWTELLPLIPDAGENTVILFDPRGLPDSRQIGANTWNTTRVLEQLYQIPKSWKNPPRVFRLYPEWAPSIISQESPVEFHINGNTTQSPESLYQDVSPGQVILIDSEAGHLIRQQTPLTIQSQTIDLKPVSAPILPTFPKGFLYSIMILK